MLNAEETMEKQIGAFFKKKRLEKGWSQRKLAGDADVHFTYYSQIERGKRGHVSVKILKKIADVLGVKLSEMGL